jgi:Dyp-type peroxidase family
VDLDLSNIQGNIVPGFSKDHQAFVFVRFRDGEGGRKWLAALQPEIASAHEVQGFKLAFKSMQDRRPHPTEPDGGSLSHISATWVNLAISFAGLRLLPGVGNVDKFAPAFRTNRVPGADGQAVQGHVHALLIVAADDTADLDVELDRQRQRMIACGVDEVTILRGDTLPGDQRGHEHFGFKDAISQPLIAGTSWGTPPPVAAGEFILGYPDESGQSPGAGLPNWTRNGSFLAFLQLQQHVATFWSTMKQYAQQFGVQPEDVAAWIVGRKRDADGTPLANPPARLAHIGRAYSRWLPPTEASRHRIIRRGIPYGSPWQEGQTDDDQRGLLFVTYQADIERQFQFVWTQWLGQVGFPVPAAGTDALAGQVDWPGRAAPAGTPSPPAPWNPRAQRPASAKRAGQTGGIVSLSLPAFVTPCFGGYFFAPGIDVLSQIAGRAAQTSSHGGVA